MAEQTREGAAIDRIPASDVARFYEDYYRLEQPVVITGLGAKLEVDTRTARDTLLDRVRSDGTARDRFLWFDVPPRVLDGVLATPRILEPLLDDPDVHRRPNFVRVWLNPGGHVTPWHYDGNSIHGWNLQLEGRKRWTLVSPDTPLACAPFSNTCLFRRYDLTATRHHEFFLDPGELLFLPRYWFHRVESLGEVNVNVNWVLTPKRRPPSTRTARREAELLGLRSRLRRLLPRSIQSRLGPDEAAQLAPFSAVQQTYWR